jgi:hypothetical protein
MAALGGSGATLALQFWKFALRSRSGQFGTLLNLHPVQLGGSLEIRSITPDSSQVAVQVPQWCCSPADGRLRLSAALAMVDEVSSK